MLHNFKNFVQLSSHLIKKCEFHTSFLNENVFNGLKCVLFQNHKKNFHTDTPRNKHSNILDFRRAQKEAVSKTNVKEFFEGSIMKKRREGYFPTVDLPNTCFNDIPFKNLPIIYIKCTRNNTIMALVENGLVKLKRSCGMDGFKNARKGTNVAAQTTGTSMGMRAVKKGFKVVRVVLNGLGPGRLSSLKGLSLGGLDVVSITDDTTDYTSLRPRKQKRL